VSAEDSAGLDAYELSKIYDGIAALDALELSVRPGELVALAGANGAGKSTLLRLAAGLLEPSDGEIWIDGFAAGSIEARAACSYIGDQPSLYGDLSVREHIEYVANVHGLDGDWPAAADTLLSTLDLDERVDDLPVHFSRGLRQKTSLVLGLTRPFSVLLVDEPFVGLDPAGQDALSEILVATAAGGAAVVTATHQLTFLERTTRCVVLDEGAIVFDDAPNLARIAALLE
jgi:ABC-type multidrug transport system ATPase subunit